MALDIAILGKDGSPASSVSLPITAHGRMMHEAKRTLLPLLGRLNDYWGDVTFDVSELKALRSELERLMLNMSDDKEVQSIAGALISLVDLSAEKNTEIHALAD